MFYSFIILSVTKETGKVQDILVFKKLLSRLSPLPLTRPLHAALLLPRSSASLLPNISLHFKYGRVGTNRAFRVYDTLFCVRSGSVLLA